MSTCYEKGNISKTQDIDVKSDMYIKNQIYEGWIYKKSKHFKNYHRRFMQLKENKLFCYNTDQLDEENIKPTEVFNLNINRYRVSIHNITNEKFYLIDETNNKSRTFKAESETERTEWVKQIQNSCKRIRRNTYDNKLLSIDPNDYMAQLVYNRKLFPIKSTDNQQFTHIFDKYSALICCCVSPKSRAIPYSAFESTHYIYFQYKHIELKKDKRKESFNANNYQTQTRFAYFLIHISYYQLAEIDKLIKKNNKNGKMFGDEYPQPLQETKNKRGDLHKQYLCEESLVTKSILPIGPSKLIKRYMTTKDVKEYATYLHKILNCSELLLMDELYDILDICDPEIINLFKLLAYTKLKTLSSVANEYDLCNVCRDPTKLKTKHDITFHTLWIVKRPLNNRNAALLGCDHWALKWEGNDHLMTSGFFSYNDKHGIILTKIVANSPLNRRLFWYYWSRDNSDEIEPQHFNSRWIVLEKLYLGEISCALIGSLIEEWLSYNNHAKYDLRSNNCQDYVCHMVAPLDINISKRLTSAYDIKMAQSLIPAGLLTQGIDAQAKCNSARTRLWPILFKYQKDMKLKKQKQNYDKKAKLEKKGIHVELTYWPDTSAEEIQIKGRTARQGNRGSFHIILHGNQIKDLFKNARNGNAYYSNDISNIWCLCCYPNGQYSHNERQLLLSLKLLRLPPKIKYIEAFEKQYDEPAADEEESLRTKDTKTAKEKLLLFNKGAKLQILIDATGSMSSCLNQCKTVVQKTIPELVKFLKNNNINTDSFEIQIIAYRNYNADAQFCECSKSSDDRNDNEINMETFVEKWNKQPTKTNINLNDIVECFKKNNMNQLYLKTHTRKQFTDLLTKECSIKKSAGNTLWKYLNSGAKSVVFSGSDSCAYYTDAIEKLLSNVAIRQTIIGQTDWHNVKIFNKKNQNGKKIKLCMEQSELMTSFNQFIDNNVVKMVPIIVFDDKERKRCINHVWIIPLGDNVGDIGISFKYNKDNNTAIVNGIYLDKEYLLECHTLLPSHKTCNCLEHFHSKIDILTVHCDNYDQGQLMDYVEKYTYEQYKYEQYKGLIQKLINNPESKRLHFEIKQILCSSARWIQSSG